MRFLLIVTLLLQHLVFNTAVASVHLSHSEHGGRETPHLHGDQIIKDLLSLVSQRLADQTQDGEHEHDGSEVHVHVHLLAPQAQLLSPEPNVLSHHLFQPPAQGDLGMRAPPLLPPPNHS
ncbi:hypothetical protein CHH28_13110 [Bacterioplanes sanyensis]|uniref:Cobalt transporter n=1 Tax=Bacterioplanes sanyensis TaxID=1249553 RepID=A0A222FKI3_9GAMM|nr:hypothetical protein [Bacterioplanes sanyensis]ASP39557.1 hypothetical protein CHH28_13110 [Bacterioplanes sanyensis]